MHTQCRGITLIELLIVLFILALLVRLGAPAYAKFVTREHSVAALNALLGAVNLARASAATQNRSMVLCPSRSTEEDAPCAKRDDWHLGAMIFADSNGNGQRNAGEALIGRLPGWSGQARVTWRSFQNRTYLRFRSNGMTDWQNGSFTWCPPDADPTLAVQVILNAGGRARTARDSDGDGIAEDSSGKPLTC